MTFCLGLLVVLSGVTAISQVREAPSIPPGPPVPPLVGIPKGGAGILETRDMIVVYDQGRGKGKVISKITTIEGRPEMHEFVIR